MELVSSSKDTQHHSFPDLKTKCIYPHDDNEESDFQFFNSKMLAHANKKFGFELLRLKHIDGADKIQRVKKIRVDNVQCMACPKGTGKAVALGLTTGAVRLCNFSTAEYTKRFAAEIVGVSVVFLDFSLDDSHLASVYENGVVNLYGLNTGIKLSTYKLDKSSTLARFHTVKRFNLSVASFKGAVTVLDVQTKKTLFSREDAHASPCRDLCTPSLQPDILLTVGFDCILNIFDTRRRTQIRRVSHKTPLSCACISDCGNFICVGNLKGELISYDMRQLNKALSSKRAHDSAVVRTSFVPNQSIANNVTTMDFDSASINVIEKTEMDSMNIDRRSVAPSGNKRDSFIDFFDMVSSRDTREDAMERPSLAKRDSFLDWDINHRRTSMSTSRRTSNRYSDAGARQLLAHIETFDTSGLIDEVFSEHSPVIDRSSPFNEKETRPEDVSRITKRRKGDSASVLRQKPDLNNIAERLLEEDTTPAVDSLIVVAATGSDKENLNASPNNCIKDFLSLPGNRNSTPQIPKIAITQNNDAIAVPSVSQFANEMSELKQEIRLLEGNINFQIERAKFDTYRYNYNISDGLKREIDILTQHVSVLMHDDQFVQDYLKLKAENDVLRAENNALKTQRGTM